MIKQTMLALASAAALGVGFVGSAEAVQITLGSNDYEVSTLTGTYNDLLADLSMNLWFTSSALDLSARRQANPGSSAFLAFDAGGLEGVGYSIPDRTFFNRQIFDPGYFTRVNTFAVGTLVEPEPEPVPEPTSMLGLLPIGAIAAGGALKKKVAA